MSKSNARIMLMRGALLLALALMFQGIRLIVPLPPFAGMFIIGSLVNATLVLAVRYTGILPSLLMSALLPIVAFMQGQIALFLLIPVVAVGNMFLVLLCHCFWNQYSIIVVPLMKTLTLYLGCFMVIELFAIAPPIAEVVMLMLSWPQLVTSGLGILLAQQLTKRIALFN